MATPSGVTAEWRDVMTRPTAAAIQTQSTSGTLLAVAFVALTGALTVFTVGLAQSAALHDAAHDTRHATGFPCH